MRNEASFSPHEKGLGPIVCKLSLGSCCVNSECMVKRTNWPYTQKVGLVNPYYRPILP